MPKHDIIFIAAEPWEHYTWRRRHHVAWNLAKNNRVLFVEPPLTVRQPFSAINLNWRHLLNLGRFKYQGRNLYSYSPVRLFPLSFPGSKRFNYYEIDKQRTFNTLNKIVKKLEFKNPILWVFHNNYQYHYYGLFNEKIVVTDWYDDFFAPTSQHVDVKSLNQQRKKLSILLKKADIMFVPSFEMKNKLAKYRKDVRVISHGVDTDLYKDSNGSFHPIMSLEKVGKPILCYLGTMYTKIDFELLMYIAINNPDWTLLLIGKEWFKIPHKKDREIFLNLIKMKNIIYCKEISRDLIPSYLFYADVCLIPYKNMQLNYVTTAPLKLFEYFAAGKPVVATDLGRPYKYSHMIRTGKTFNEFCDQVRKAIPENSDKRLVSERHKIAYENSWDEKVQEAMQIIENHISHYKQNQVVRN